MRGALQVKVLGCDFSVCEDKNESERFEYHGALCKTDQVIRLRPGMHPDRERNVLLHEMVHAADGLITIRSDQQPLDETEVDRIVHVFASFLRENPHLFALEGDRPTKKELTKKQANV